MSMGSAPMDLRTEASRLVEATPLEERESPQFAARLNNLAVILQKAGAFAEADGLYKQSLVIWERTIGPSHLKVAQSLSNRASLYRLMHEFHEAERVFQLAIDIWSRHRWPEQEEMAQQSLSDDAPLWADQVESNGLVRQYRDSVRDLRRRVESGSADAAAAAQAKEELQGILLRLGPWFHNINFSGVDSHPVDPDYPARRWRLFEPLIPKDLTGKTVLDIGCNAGFLSLEMKKRNASRVVASDFMPHWVGQARFASYWHDLPLEPRLVDVYDLPSLGERFDYVIFVGVLYHLKHPLYALEKVEQVCKDTMLFQSLMRGPLGDFTPAENYVYDDKTFFEDPKFPKLYFLEKSFNADSSNWWMATQSCLKAMLRVSGFTRIADTAEPDHFVCRKA